ncbi:phosphatase PAP2 family protein [Hymenobacter psychrotolerans]|uniref:PAP2 superfamily protein n=1 Tax=Hymenobacter psychrotolerans DSM 18569 TaxID=1121959 RepID=A0A1M6Y1H8_9BACT|nr:phosphatase PAP2 family protein [Hymenobacter psychrotolerans]SHL12018.1 PAP2 superfamily protein [Hymenobacter psychrotolerans DSM 18569]
MLDSLLVRRVAAVVSGLGHPLVLVPALVAFVAGRPGQGAVSGWAMGSVLLVVAAIGLWNLRQTRRGAYTNFDVSERKQRNSFYPVLLVVLGLATLVLFWQPHADGGFRYGLAAAWGLLLMCYLLNFWLKVSLHAAISFFLACVLLHLEPTWGITALVLAALIAASRLVLRRHTLAELLVGSAVGGAAGGGLMWLLSGS